MELTTATGAEEAGLVRIHLPLAVAARTLVSGAYLVVLGDLTRARVALALGRRLEAEFVPVLEVQSDRVGAGDDPGPMGPVDVLPDRAMDDPPDTTSGVHEQIVGPEVGKLDVGHASSMAEARSTWSGRVQAEHDDDEHLPEPRR